MAIPTDTPSAPETSLQRRQRLAKEGLRRGAVPSKAELAAQERERREEGLSRSLFEPDRTSLASSAKPSKGLAMMAKMGFRPGATLGAAGAPAPAEPLRIEVREDRGGLGLEGERKRKLDEVVAADGGAGKRARPEVDEGDYRARVARERDAARKEKLVCAAQKIAERMDEDAEEDRARTRAARPLRSVPVVYRGLVRGRESEERDRRMRHDLETSAGTLSARLPTYEDETLDEDDKLALGREDKKTVFVAADDLDEEDPELDEFEALDVDERLGRLTGYLRSRYRYCFWCKFTYPDEGMEGCPGPEEEDHD